MDAAAVCGHLLDPKSVYGFLAEHRARVFPDGLFEDLFPTNRGRPSIPAEVVATVMVLQKLEGLSDHDAVQHLAVDIRWKAAAGLALTDGAFHSTVLTLWRNKLKGSDRPQRIFDAVRELINATGVVAGKHRRVLDSTVLDDAVARQDTITQLASAIRRVRRLIPETASAPVREWNLEPGRPACDWDDPADIDRLITELVDDALEVLGAAFDLEDAGHVLTAEQDDAVGLLALVSGQDVEEGDRPGLWRIARRTAPDRIVSTVDPESRHAHKTQASYRDGFKAHVAVEPETGLVTACDLGPGNVGDATAAPGLLQAEPAGTEVLGDSAYGTGDLRAHLAERNMDACIKPPPLRPAVPGGFTLDDFDIADGHITCPMGVTVKLTTKGRASFGAACAECPFRDRCTTAAKGRTIVLHPHHDLLVQARRQAATDEHQATYRQQRPMVERTLAWLVRGPNRRVPYRGIKANQLWWSTRCAAINLQRLLTLGLTYDHRAGWTLNPATAG
jgi:IS5 family transposase